MFRSSGSDKYQQKRGVKGCCCIKDYQDQINILQQKLMEVHNKLIEQLDVCQEQQLTIIQLTKKIILFQRIKDNPQNSKYSNSRVSYQSQTYNEADVSNQQEEFNRNCFNKNIQFTLNNSHQLLNNSNQIIMSNYNSPTFIQNNRNQLLKADLQVMRLKLLEEVTQKTSIKQELNQLKLVHNQKINQYKQQIKNLQNDHQFLLKEYEYIKINLDKGNLKKNDKYIQQQLLQLNQKSNQFQRLYHKQLQLNQQLNHKIVQLKSNLANYKEKIISLQQEIDKQNHCVKSTSTAADGFKQQRQRDREQLCGTIRISKNPGTLWQKESNKTKISQKSLDNTNQMFKKRNTLADINYTKQKNTFDNGNYSKERRQQIRKQEVKRVQSIKQQKKERKGNKQNVNQSLSSIKSGNKQKISKVNKREDYESTKQLIRKLQEAEMITRQKRKTVFG